MACTHRSAARSLDTMMSTEQFSALIAELRGIKLALDVAAALVVISVVFAAVRTYFAARHHVDRELDTLFKQEAKILFEKNDLERLIADCRAHLKDRPNHPWARWYLGRALLLQEHWTLALAELTILRRKFPEWAASIDPLTKEARNKLGDGTDPVGGSDA